MAAECGVTLGVRESAGSVENMQAVRDRPATQLGIVQSDVLEYYRTFAADDPDLRRPARGVRVAFPLYDEEVHVLARRDIATLADLAGRKVATGVADGGTKVTADLILDLAQVEPAERLSLAPEAALEALLAGEIDALFYVVGAPAALFDTERIDPAAIHLVPLTGPELTAAYTPAEMLPGLTPSSTSRCRWCGTGGAGHVRFRSPGEQLSGGELPDARRSRSPSADTAGRAAGEGASKVAFGRSR